MFSKIQTIVSKWFGETLLIFIVGYTVYLTSWAMGFANLALAAKVSLVDTASAIAAVAGIPIAMLTLALNKYLDLTKDSSV
jgi:hypothetical protein